MLCETRLIPMVPTNLALGDYLFVDIAQILKNTIFSHSNQKYTTQFLILLYASCEKFRGWKSNVWYQLYFVCGASKKSILVKPRSVIISPSSMKPDCLIFYSFTSSHCIWHFSAEYVNRSSAYKLEFGCRQLLPHLMVRGSHGEPIQQLQNLSSFGSPM